MSFDVLAGNVTFAPFSYIRFVIHVFAVQNMS